MNATLIQKDDHFILATGGRFGKCILYKISIESKIENNKNNDKQIKNDKNQKNKKINLTSLITAKLFKLFKNQKKLSIECDNDTIKSDFTISFLTEFQADFNTIREQYLKVVRYSSTTNCLITGGSDGCIRLFDYSNFKLIRLLKAHEDEIMNLVIDRTGFELISISRDRHAYVWDLKEPLTKVKELKFNNNKLNSKYYFRDCIFDNFEKKEEKIIKTESKTTSLGEIEFNKSEVNNIKLKNNEIKSSNELLSNQSLYTLHNSFTHTKPASKSLICKWNTKNYEIDKFIYSSQESFSKITISDDNQYLGVGLLNGTVEIYNTINLQKLYTMKNSHKLFVTDVEFLKSFNKSGILVGNQKISSLLSTSVDQIIIIHYLSKNDHEFGYLNSSILFISFLFFIYILFMYLGL